MDVNQSIAAFSSTLIPIRQPCLCTFFICLVKKKNDNYTKAGYSQGAAI